MVFQIRRNSLKKQRKSSRKINRKSRQLNKQQGAGPPVHILYAQKDSQYYLIYIGDNQNDLILLSKDVPDNMSTKDPFQKEVIDHMYIQTQSLDVKPKNYNTPRQLVATEQGVMPMRSNDEIELYYTLNDRGLVKYIYTNKEKLQKVAPEAQIFTLKKNNVHWKSPIFQ
jgi:hypothetical protein